MELPRCLGSNLASQGLIMLIGRDILSRCTLHYNGANGAFTLCV